MSQTPPQPHQRSSSDQRRATSKPPTSAHSSTSSLSSSSSHSLPPSQIPQLSDTAAPPPVTPARKPKTPRASAKGEGTSIGGGSGSRQTARPPISPDSLPSLSPPVQTPSPPLPTTPTPTQKRKGGEMKPKTTSVFSSSKSIRNAVDLEMDDSPVDRAFRKAWQLFVRSDSNQIKNDQYPAFVNSFEGFLDLPINTLLPPEWVPGVTMTNENGRPIELDMDAANELLRAAGAPDTLLNCATARLKECGNLSEEDALSRSTMDTPFDDNSTGELDFPSDVPVCGSTPTQRRPGQSRLWNQPPPPSLDATHNKSLFVDLDDSTVYKEKDNLEESILLPNTDLRPKAASKRPTEEIARVYAEVRRLQAVVRNRDRTINDTLDQAQDWEGKYCNGQKTIETLRDDFEEAMASLIKERDGLAEALDATREELRLTTETKDRKIASLDSLVDAQLKDIAQLMNKVEKIPTSPRHDLKKESAQAATIERLELELVAERGKNRLVESRLHTYTETQVKRMEELENAQQELQAANMAATEMLAQRDEELEKLNKTVTDLEHMLQVATATGTTTRRGVAVNARNSGNAEGPQINSDGGGSHGGLSSGFQDGLSGGLRGELGSELESDYEYAGDSPGFTRPFRGSRPQIPGLEQRQLIQQAVYMNLAGREIQTDIEIPPGEDRPVIECVAWLQDPTLAAINELKQQIPEVVEEATSNDAECQTAEAWPTLPTTVEGDERRRQVEAKDREIQAEAKDYKTQADPESAASAVSAPHADNYQELITTNTATRAKLKGLMTKPELTLADHAFLTNFVMAQSTSPSREILHSVWRLAQPAARAVRMTGAKTYDDSSTADEIFRFPRMHGSIGILAWPLRLLWDSFQGLDHADYYASTNPRGEHASPDSKPSAESSDSANPKPKPNTAPRGTQAALLRAGPRSGVAWSILTAGLYLFILVLLMSNMQLYRSMKQEQGLWVRTNEPSPGRFASPGCWRVCHTDSWGWRWKALIREWVTEHSRSWPA